MGRDSKKNKEKCAWGVLQLLVDNLVEEYGFDKRYWLKKLSDSDFLINLFNVETGFWGEGVVFHRCKFMGEMHMKGLLSVYEIRKMQERRENTLIEYLAKKRTENDLVKARLILQTTKTYTCLRLIDTDFYWKSFEELCFLTDKELDKDIQAWEKQTGIKYEVWG